MSDMVYGSWRVVTDRGLSPDDDSDSRPNRRRQGGPRPSRRNV